MSKYAVLSGFVSLVSAASLITPQFAHAKDDGLVCAAVFPCNESGDLLPEFSDPSSSCHSAYSKQCERFRDDMLERQALETAVGQLQIENSQLKQENRRLRRMVNRSRS